MSLAKHFSRAAMLASAATLAIGSYAKADVTISLDATANMSCSGGVCSPTAKKAVLNVTDLENLLASGDVEVTTKGSGVQARNLQIKAAFSWSNNSTLRLDALNAIAVDGPVDIAGRGNLTIATGKGGTFAVGSDGSVKFANITSNLEINGAQYVLIGNIKTLASDIAVNPAGSFALADPYDASVDGTYSSCPVATTFEGQFEGLGNSISNLSIDGPCQIEQGTLVEGLFAYIATGAGISDVYLENVSISMSRPQYYVFLGAIAALLSGTITSSYASGSLVVPKRCFGGGLVGETGASTIKHSVSAIDVSGDTNYDTGGLVAVNSGTIEGSSATGIVNTSRGGGLVGQNSGQISDSLASGSVTGSLAGGLAAINTYEGSIEYSYSTSNVQATHGYFPPTVGGLAGINEGLIDNSYSTGAVTGLKRSDTGGLVGLNYGPISSSYSTGVVSGGTGSVVGGLIGDDVSSSGSLSDTYWDLDTSGITNPDQGAGNVTNDPGITGLTTEQFQSGLPTGFDPFVWKEKSRINNGLPYLINNPPPK